jgi:O-antigen/teichoic acid export membrane protein
VPTDPLASAQSSTFRRYLARSSLFVFGGQLLRIASTFTVLVILAHQLARPAYASSVLFFLVVTVGGTVIRCGLPKSCVRAIADASVVSGRARAESVAWIGAVTAGALALVAVPVASIAVHYLARDVLNDPFMTRLSWLVGVAIAVEGYQLTVAEIFRGFHRVGTAVMLGYAARSALLVLAVAGLAVTGESSVRHVIEVYVACDALPAIVGSAMLIASTRTRAKADVRAVEVVRQLLSIGAAMAIVELTTFFLTQGDSLVVGAVASHTDTALYNTGSRVANLLALPYFATALVLPPIVAGLWASGQRGRLERTVRAGAFIGAVPGALVYLVIAILGRPIMAEVFGHGYRGAALYFIVLGTGPVLNAATGAAVTVLTMVGEQRVVAIITVILTVVTVGSEVALGRAFGAMGVAVASVLGTIVSNLALSIVALRRTKVRTWLYLRPTQEAFSVLQIATEGLRGAKGVRSGAD